MLISIAAGAVAGLLLYFLVSLALLHASVLVFLAGWAAFALIFYYRAGPTREIWFRACLVCGLLCLAIPPALEVFPIFFGQESVQAAGQEARAAGENIGFTPGGSVISLLSGYFGLVIGFLLLATAYLSLKPARRRR